MALAVKDMPRKRAIWMYKTMLKVLIEKDVLDLGKVTLICQILRKYQNFLLKPEN